MASCAAVVLIVGDDLDRPARHGVAHVVERAAGKVNITADGCVSTSVASEPWSLAWTMLPGSTRRTPMRPSLGAVMVVYSRLVCAVWIIASSAAIDGLELIDLGLLLVDDLLRRDVREHQRLRTREVFLGRGELGLVLRLLGLGLVERGLEQARIDLGEHVALLDVLPLGEQHLLQLAVDLRMDADGKGSLHRAESGEVDRHVLPAHDRDAHRDGRACRKAGRTRSFGRLRPTPICDAAAGEGCDADYHQDDTATA